MTAAVELTSELGREVARRRTFAIISHPDAGKTTLTEKLLLYGGAIEEAGSVRARKAQRHTTSDWMAIEQSRGISITSTVLQFEYNGAVLNLLDTPGHQDFSEDTYRTLAATDSAVMVLDGAKGIEPQTRKLFEVCRMRHIPILCFINKLDQSARDPFELIGELEPVDPTFTGFVFKIQANMDKRHRDRLAFMRITSGAFEKDMLVHHARLGREVRMTRPHRLFARERVGVERAYPGDVIGFVNPGLFQIGDAVSSGDPVEFDRIPRFAPEHYATLRAKQVTRQKQFQKGLE